MTSLPVSTSQFQLRGDREIAQILIQDINIYSRCDIKFSQSASSNLNWNGRFYCRPKLLKSRLVSWSVAAQFSITWQWRTQATLLQCPFERRTLAEKLKVQELGLDQPDSLIYCEELFAVPVCHSPTSKKFTCRHWTSRLHTASETFVRHKQLDQV